MDGMKCPRCGADGQGIDTHLVGFDCRSYVCRGKFEQTDKCRFAELEQLRAIVDPLRKLADSGVKWVAFLPGWRERFTSTGDAAISAALRQAVKQL